MLHWNGQLCWPKITSNFCKYFSLNAIIVSLKILIYSSAICKMLYQYTWPTAGMWISSYYIFTPVIEIQITKSNINFSICEWQHYLIEGVCNYNCFLVDNVRYFISLYLWFYSCLCNQLAIPILKMKHLHFTILISFLDSSYDINVMSTVLKTTIPVSWTLFWKCLANTDEIIAKCIEFLLLSPNICYNFLFLFYIKSPVDANERLNRFAGVGCLWYFGFRPAYPAYP